MRNLTGACLVAAACAVMLLGPARVATASQDEPPRGVAAGPQTFRLRVSAIGRDGYYPSVSVSNSSAFQAGAVLVMADHAASGSATIFGRKYPLMATGESLAGYVGLGTEDPPGPATITIDVTGPDGGSLRFTRTLTVLRTKWTVDYIDLPPDSGGGVLQDPNVGIREQNRLDAIYAKVTPRKWRDRWISPIPGRPIPDTSDVSGYFGEQRSFNGGPVAGHHGGTDLGLAAGTPVLAANDGVVVLANLLDVRGNMVIIDHGGGVFTGYGHMSELDVKVGDAVAQGTVIGKVGTTGLSTGPHLHWEMSVSGVLVDALRWVDGSQGF